MNILVPLAEGLEELEAITIIDVLRRAGLAVTTASLTDEKLVTSSHNVIIQADALLNELQSEDFAAIVLPGGGTGTDNLMSDKRIIQIVQAFDAVNKYVCAVCAAPTVLAAAGILDGLKGTCYPTCAEALGESYTDVPVVADGNIITSQGPGTALLFSLVMVHHFAGEEAAHSVAKAMLTTY
ncbi:MAG: DJ-1/PfpI family protein [Kiritimatiellae bacterium]|jgi:4-methyl-5(b-hydroxyethyl)-thiazole monophosphate biosynthesis|nr:DJ-1/PfpI family protein [Kiritimatiellia bacterium]